MKVIVNRGFDKILTRIVVFKNERKIATSSMRRDYCKFEAEEGDKVEIGLKLFDATTSIIASFICNRENEVIYVRSTRMCKKYELLSFKILPTLCALSFLLKILVVSEVYEWLFMAMITFIVLSVIGFQCCMLIPFVRKRLFYLEHLQA